MTRKNWKIKVGIVATFLSLAGLFALPASAQVSVQMQGGEIVIKNKGYKNQRIVRANSKSSRWKISDNVGNTFDARHAATEEVSSGDFAATPVGDDDPDDDPIIIVGGYQAPPAGDDDPDDDPIIIVGGYQSVLDLLVQNFGAVITHDATLNVDLIAFPDSEDPVTTFFTIITTESLNGHLLIDYFKSVEISSLGTFDPPESQLAKPAASPLLFPSDVYYANQWNLLLTQAAKAQWHPVLPKKQVLISIIDSGIKENQRLHEGLDGSKVEYFPVAPTFGFNVPHALELVTLLTDRANEGSGVIGLLGDSWANTGCYNRPSLLSRMPPRIHVYNVGDFAPISVYVAHAITESVNAGADVINLSLALGYSPLVEQAVKNALLKGVIVVAAAGNYSPDAMSKPTMFPANISGVIAVGSAGKDMKVTRTSANTGVTILAPGEQIVVGAPDNTWINVSGTSFATVHVTAAAAMMRAVKPSISSYDVIKALHARATKVSESSFGFLNSFASLNHVLPESERVRDVPYPHECTVSSTFATTSSTSSGFISTKSDPAASVTEKIEMYAAMTELPEEPVLNGNYPNPFNPSTLIEFAVPDVQKVRLSVYDVLGKEVAVLVDGTVESGVHAVEFDASGLPSGLYITRLSTASGSTSRTMMMAK